MNNLQLGFAIGFAVVTILFVACIIYMHCYKGTFLRLYRQGAEREPIINRCILHDYEPIPSVPHPSTGDLPVDRLDSSASSSSSSVEVSRLSEARMEEEMNRSDPRRQLADSLEKYLG